jgi:hypothetical protein
MARARLRRLIEHIAGFIVADINKAGCAAKPGRKQFQ